MTTPPPHRSRRAPKPVPDPKRLLPGLRSRRDRERAALSRWQGRLLRAFHAFEKQLRLVARLDRRVARLERE